MDPLSATDARRRDTWPEDVWLPTPAKAEQPRKQMALGVAGWTPEGVTKAMSHDTSALSVNGQTLESITGEANLSSMEQLEKTPVLSVTAIATVRAPQEVIPG